MIPDAKGARFSPLTLLAMAALLGILALHLVLVLQGAGRLRDQHLGTALLYASGNMDVVRPVIVGFNAGGTPTPLEFPLWLAATGATMRVLGQWWGWGNVMAWLLFASCLVPFHRLAARHLGGDAAGWATLALLAQPLIVLQAGQAGTDGTALAASVWLIWAIDRMVRDGSWRFCAAAAACAMLSATQKLPFFMAAGIAGLGLVAAQRPVELRRWVQLGFVGAVGTGAFYLWTRHADHELVLSEFPFIDLRVAGNPAMQDWYFGSWSYRLDPGNWIRAGYRLAQGVLGSFLLLPLVCWAAFDRRQWFARWWLGGVLVATLVFTHLVLHHWHYYLMVSPAFALLVGGGLAQLTARVPLAKVTSRWTLPALGSLLLLLASVQGLHGSHFLLRDDFPRHAAATLTEHTRPTDRLLVAGGGWGGLELILSQRQGLTIANAAFLENSARLLRLRTLGYNKLVLLSQSPKNAAISVIGGSQVIRRSWRELLTPAVRDWPVLFEDENISIRALPTQ